MQKRKKILFIGGSLNQTSMMHKISRHFDDCDCRFSPYYGDGVYAWGARNGLLNWTVLGGEFVRQTCAYMKEHELVIDRGGAEGGYDLVFTGSDLLMQKNILDKRIVLVQEGMTDPENFTYYMARYLPFPRWFGSTSTNGLSGWYDRFCVASEGYKDKFASKGAPRHKLAVTGIPNFDDVARWNDNDFPHRGHALVATSDARETMKIEFRKKFIRECVAMARGKKMIFKLHPNERVERATREIKEIVPDAIVYADGNINEMIANCDILITKYSSVVYVGIALGKEVHSYFDLEELKRLTPVQNGGKSAENIANVGRELLEIDVEELNRLKPKRYLGSARNANRASVYREGAFSE
jgi:hypothetical protein